MSPVASRGADERKVQATSLLSRDGYGIIQVVEVLDWWRFDFVCGFLCEGSIWDFLEKFEEYVDINGCSYCGINCGVGVGDGDGDGKSDEGEWLCW